MNASAGRARDPSSDRPRPAAAAAVDEPSGGGHPYAIAILAKEPVAGRVKTRLCPPYRPEQAARIAAAALEDTLDAVASTRAAGRFLVFDGDAAGWQRAGFTTVAQRGRGLDERLGNAMVDVAAASGLPVLLVGMDTPQLRPRMLELAAHALRDGDAVLGPAADGGFWAIGLNVPRLAHFAGVPMSRSDTGREQLERLGSAGLRTTLLDVLTDVDDASSAHAVAAAAPTTRFARLLAALDTAAA